MGRNSDSTFDGVSRPPKPQILMYLLSGPQVDCGTCFPASSASSKILATDCTISALDSGLCVGIVSEVVGILSSNIRARESMERNSISLRPSRKLDMEEKGINDRGEGKGFGLPSNGKQMHSGVERSSRGLD
ncbi:hypothetical protein PM082_004793 [Marasmius tenuissimus]|nr:hypothetical protein PM082_004793 [Marasmius tenuissimus]